MKQSRDLRETAPSFQFADVSSRVWAGLLAARTGGVPSVLPKGWTPPERAAFALYAPLLAAGLDGVLCYAQVGQSIDGRVATVSGDARDVSGLEGLCHLHRCRALADAVVVGVRTALTDDPRLTVRLVDGPSPSRVVIDPKGRLPANAAVFAPDGQRRIVIQGCDMARPEGVEVLRLPMRDGWIAPRDIRRALAGAGLGRVLVEGGGITIAGFLEEGLLDRLHVSIAPLIIGAGPTGLRTAPIARLSDALRPETRVYGLQTDVIFDCALGAPGIASTSQCPTMQAEVSHAALRA